MIDKVLKVYKSGERYVVGGLASFYLPEEAMEEYDLSDLKMNEIEEFKRNPRMKKFDKKIRKIK